MSTKPRPLFDFNSKTDPKLVLSRGSAVYAGLKDNPAFTNPPPTVDLTALKSALDDLSAWIGNALDGGKKAIAERNHKQEVVVKMLRQLAHYVEANCKDDINIFLSSGFCIFVYLGVVVGLFRLTEPIMLVRDAVRHQLWRNR